MTSLDNPLSARRMILARITSQYGDVYFRAIDSSVCRSSPERFMSNGLLHGIRRMGLLMFSLSDYVTDSIRIIRHRIYVYEYLVGFSRWRGTASQAESSRVSTIFTCANTIVAITIR